MTEQDPVASAERQIRAGALAQEIFKSLNQAPNIPGVIDYEVGVISTVEEYEPNDPMYRYFMPDARFFSVSEGLHFTTDTSNSLASQIGNALIQGFNRLGEDIEEEPARIANAINTSQTNGIVPQMGDVIMFRRKNGCFGGFTDVRIISIDSPQQDIVEAIADITTSIK